MSFTFDIPPELWKSLNRSGQRYGHSARITRELQALVVPIVDGLHIPYRARLTWSIAYPYGVGPKADASNCVPVTKALLDGAVNAGLFGGDDWRYIASETFQRVPNLDVRKLHRITLSVSADTNETPIHATA